ncbi:hypothetical protein LCL95_01265 [Bacillus timonensis]|nr:hypothetical protein [Bacillus timonensis]
MLKKIGKLFAVSFLSLMVLSACNDKEEITDVEVAAGGQSQLADSMAITLATLGKVKMDYENRDTLPLVDTNLDDKTVTLTFEASQDVKQEDAEKIVKEVLMEISKSTVDSKAVDGGYATVYDHYDVKIVLKDGSGTVLEGNMPKGTQKIDWK